MKGQDALFSWRLLSYRKMMQKKKINTMEMAKMDALKMQSRTHSKQDFLLNFSLHFPKLAFFFISIGELKEKSFTEKSRGFTLLWISFIWFFFHFPFVKLATGWKWLVICYRLEFLHSNDCNRNENENGSGCWKLCTVP